MIYIQHPLPLITPRIEFQLAPPPPLPTITSRIEFNLEQLALNQTLGRDERQLADQVSRGSDQEPDRPPLLSQTSLSNKVPKPPGEPGRPGSGGFCVESTLVDTHKWTKEAVNDLSVWVY